MAKKRVGIWIRVSTGEQAEGDSPEHHEKRARAYCEAKDWKPVELYNLAGVSGKSVIDHDETQRMLGDIESGHIEALIFSKLARLVRNTKESLEIAEVFEKHNANLVSLGEAIDTSTPGEKVFFTINSAISQWEREEIASRVAASVPVRAKLGKSTGGQAIFGYQWKDNKLIPHPDEAPVRKLIYETFRECRKKRTTARILNEKGYRTRNGSEFSDTTVDRLIRDTTAKGIRLANYTQHQGDNKSWKLKPEEDWIKVPVEPIVSEELWDECNQILTDMHKRYSRGGGRKTVYLFGGLTYCGTCGGSQKLYYQKGQFCYRCYKCGNKIAWDNLEALFVEQLAQFLLSEERVNDHLQDFENEAQDKEQLKQGMETEHKKLQKELDALIDLYQEDGISIKDFKRRSGPIQERIKQVEVQLPSLDDEIESLRSETFNMVDFVSDGEAMIKAWPDYDLVQKRQIVESIVDRIVIENENVEFHLNYIPGSVAQENSDAKDAANYKTQRSRMGSWRR